MNEDKKTPPVGADVQSAQRQGQDNTQEPKKQSSQDLTKEQEFGKGDKPRFSVEEMYGASTPKSTVGNPVEVFSQKQNSDSAIKEDQSFDGQKRESGLATETAHSLDAQPQAEVGSVPQQLPQAVLQPNELQDQNAQDISASTSQPSQGALKPVENLPSKRRFPKVFILLAVLLLVLSGLVFLFVKFKGLGGNQLFGKKGEVVWWGLNLEEADVNPLIKDYQEKHPGVKITYIKQPPNDYRERLTNSLAAGNGPDIFEIHNSWPPMFANELSGLPSQIMSPDEFSKTFYPVVTKDLTSPKGIVGIPLEFDAITLFINEDIFASSARTPPKTWDELRALASDFTQKRDDGVIIQAGIPLGFAKNVDHWSEVLALMLIQNGASLANPSGARAKDSLDYFMLFKNDGDWDQTLPASTVAFARGKVAMYFGPTRSAFDIAEINSNLKFRTVLLPQLPKEKPTDPDFSYATYWVESVWERSRNKDAAWEFIKFVSTSESLENLNHNLKQRTNLERISPRIDMAQIWKEDTVLGSVVALAPNAKSWYLATGTNDGSTGINSQLNKVFQEVVEPETGGPKTLDSVTKDIAEILGKYKIPLQ